MKVFRIDRRYPGCLFMMTRPRGGEWLTDDARRLKRLGIDRVVSLLESNEIQELSLTEEKTVLHRHAVSFTQFPIRDRSVPDNPIEFRQLIDLLIDELKSNRTIAIHCRMGIGRTALVCAAVLLGLGEARNTVFQELSRVRGFQVPDTSEQESWVLERF
ncbi:MAG: dual specificity protein phosphatase family protein [Bacteroidia bacterium]|nr:dual specificity protein phosphatase family protein [Bacteroidia bacterium]